MKKWVSELGFRHQGVLFSAVRGCDTAPKNDPSKNMTRIFRGVILEPFCGDIAKCTSFMEQVDKKTFTARATDMLNSLDQYPFHFVMHFLHAVEVVGYCHPDEFERERWHTLYVDMTHMMHLPMETKEAMDARLGANEAVFAKNQMPPSEIVKQTEKAIAEAEEAVKKGNLPRQWGT